MKSGVGAGTVEDAGPGFLHATVSDGPCRLPGEYIEDRPHARAHVLAGGLRDLDVHIDAPVPPATVQLLQQRPQHGGLAGLPRGMQDEVLFFFDESKHVLQIDTGEGRNVVVTVRVNRPRGIEGAHGARSGFRWRPSKRSRSH